MMNLAGGQGDVCNHRVEAPDGPAGDPSLLVAPCFLPPPNGQLDLKNLPICNSSVCVRCCLLCVYMPAIDRPLRFLYTQVVAAVMVQASVRGLLGRKRVAERIEDKKQDALAVGKIQAGRRGQLGRRKVGVLRAGE